MSLTEVLSNWVICDHILSYLDYDNLCIFYTCKSYRDILEMYHSHTLLSIKERRNEIISELYAGNLCIDNLVNPSRELREHAKRASNQIIHDLRTCKYMTLRGMKNPSREVCIAALKKSAYNYQYIRNPDELMRQLYEVRRIASYIQYIENPSHEVCILAVRLNPYTLRYIKNPTDEMILETSNSLRDLKVNPDGFYSRSMF